MAATGCGWAAGGGPAGGAADGMRVSGGAGGWGGIGLVGGGASATPSVAEWVTAGHDGSGGIEGGTFCDRRALDGRASDGSARAGPAPADDGPAPDEDGRVRGDDAPAADDDAPAADDAPAPLFTSS